MLEDFMIIFIFVNRNTHANFEKRSFLFHSFCSNLKMFWWWRRTCQQFERFEDVEWEKNPYRQKIDKNVSFDCMYGNGEFLNCFKNLLFCEEFCQYPVLWNMITSFTIGAKQSWKPYHHFNEDFLWFPSHSLKMIKII